MIAEHQEAQLFWYACTALQIVLQQTGGRLVRCHSTAYHMIATATILRRLHTCIIWVHGYRMLEGLDLEGLQRRMKYAKLKISCYTKAAQCHLTADHEGPIPPVITSVTDTGSKNSSMQLHIAEHRGTSTSKAEGNRTERMGPLPAMVAC